MVNKTQKKKKKKSLQTILKRHQLLPISEAAHTNLRKGTDNRCEGNRTRLHPCGASSDDQIFGLQISKRIPKGRRTKKHFKGVCTH